MIWITMVLALLTVGVTVVCLKTRKEVRGPLSLLGYGLGALTSFLLLFSCMTTVSAGHVGVPVVFGDVRGDFLEPGIHFINPFASVPEMSFRTETYTMSATKAEGTVEGDDSIVALSSNGLRMPMDVTVPFRVVKPAAPWLYENVGPNYINVIIRPSARTAVRRGAAKFTDSECYAERREELALEMQKQLVIKVNQIIKDKYDDAPEVCFVIPDVLLRNVELPEMVKEAIERKLKSDQEAQEMEFKIAKERKEAERKEIEAEGIKKFQDIVSEGISDNLLKWKGIEATKLLAESHNTKVVIIGAGKDGLPLILGGDGSK